MKKSTGSSILERAQGTLAGQISGDSLGGLVEFMLPAAIAKAYPDGVRTMINGGKWHTFPGQPTDDSEMALLLARSLVERGEWEEGDVLERYRWWLTSKPFDCGMTTKSSLLGVKDIHSQANGALMRISPLGIFGVHHDIERIDRWARLDALLTHPNEICQEVNALFACAVAHAVKNGPSPAELYAWILVRASEKHGEGIVAPIVLLTVKNALNTKPVSYVKNQGWVLTAFQNALWHLVNSPDPETAIVDTIACGGDTDTNAAVCGALLGAVHGIGSFPKDWLTALRNCKPEKGVKGVNQSRPKSLWPADFMELAASLI